MTDAAAARERLESALAAQSTLLDDDLPERLADVATALVRCFRAGGKVLFFGNGGSAADAQHLAAELVGRYLLDRPALPALALTTDGSAVTAISNDYGFPDVFARQVEAHGAPGDVACGISTSGASENVARGLEAARRGSLVTVALTGPSAGPLVELADHWIRVPATETARIQEAHTLIGHVLCELVERALYG